MSAIAAIPPVPPARPIFWLCQVAGWGAWCTTGLLMARQQYGTVNANMLIGYGLFFGFAIGLTHALRRIIIRRGWLARSPGRALLRLASAVAALGLLFTAFVATVAFLQHGRNSDFSHPRAITLLAANLTFAASLWTIFYVGLSAWTRNRLARQQAEALERSLDNARLKALEAQISPHFLFNCLNSLRGMIAENPVHAQDMVTRLANILRHNLAHGPTTSVEPLAEQVDVMTDYLALEGVRFDERLRTQIAIDPEVCACAVPAMLLQTLVENAIKHGIAHLPEGGDVAITARREGDELVLAVENSGTLRPSPPDSTRVGLANLRERLRVLHGPAATCTLRSVAPDRVRAEVRMPLLPAIRVS